VARLYPQRLDAYALSLAALLLTAGSLADLYGRRRLFAVGIVVFTLGSLLCGLSTSPLFLSLARAGQGVGGAIMFAMSLALLSNAFRGADRGIAFGVFGAVTGVAVAVGPVLGGVITSGLSWRWIFLVNIPIGAVALAFTLTRVSESHDPAARRPDWLGFLTFSGGLAALVYGLIRANGDGWGAANVAGALAAAVVLLAAFVAIELRLQAPMLDLALPRKPTFVGGLLAAFGISASLFSLLTYLVLYVQNVLGYSAIGAGLRFLTLSGAIFVCAAVAGRVSARVPMRLLIGPGFVLVGIGLLLMRGLDPTTGWTHLIPGFVVAGAGAGLINPPLVSTAVGVVEPDRAGVASGINTTFRQVGIATGIATLGAIFTAQVRSGVRDGLTATPLASHAGHVVDAVTGGRAAHVIATAPPQARGLIAHAAAQGFVDGLNTILLVGALVVFAAAGAALALIRQRDLVTDGMASPAPAAG
jgi:EmrB/QacA subfamily drug resistance transporter